MIAGIRENEEHHYRRNNIDGRGGGNGGGGISRPVMLLEKFIRG